MAIADEQLVEKLKQAFLTGDKEAWDALLKLGWQGHKTIKGLDIKDADFSDWNFYGIRFDDSKFVKCKFIKGNFGNCHIVGCTFYDCMLNGINCSQFNQDKPAWSKCSFNNCKFDGAVLSDLSVGSCNFFICSFLSTNAANIRLDSIGFKECDFSGCWIIGSNFLKTIWEEVIIDEETDFSQVTFDPQHYSIINDQSDTTSFKGLSNKIVHWKNVRSINSIPLFEVSWAIFLISIILVNAIHTVNKTEFIEALNYPVPVPEQVEWIILGSICLAIGSTVYRFACPDIVQNFTESQWVYEHKHPRPLYLVKTLQGKLWRQVSALFLLGGGLVSGWMLLARLFDAVIYLFSI